MKIVIAQQLNQQTSIKPCDMPHKTAISTVQNTLARELEDVNTLYDLNIMVPPGIKWDKQHSISDIKKLQ